MRVKKIIFTTAVVCLLSGCVTSTSPLNINDLEAVSKSIVLKHDDFKKVTSYEGPNIALSTSDQVFLRAWKWDSNGDVDYQIYVMSYYDDDWRFYHSAHDSNGVSLNTTVISRKPASCSRYGCSHIEHVVLNVSRSYLEKNQDSGVRFKLSGKAGEAVFSVPAPYIKAFLSVAK